ncbi:hypothetical protein [Streptomyces sp. NPDC087294]|uniref:hypothetical protein n=1 Tax=Streptomyces sp. NPDC087294 TaxID=3365777 RepID=UPI0037FB52BC
MTLCKVPPPTSPTLVVWASFTPTETTVVTWDDPCRVYACATPAIPATAGTRLQVNASLDADPGDAYTLSGGTCLIRNRDPGYVYEGVRLATPTTSPAAASSFRTAAVRNQRRTEPTMANDITIEVGSKAKVKEPSAKEKKQLATLGGALATKYPKLWTRGTIVHDATMRIDNQGVLSSPFAGQNIQAQIGSSSIAAVGLANTLSVGKMSEECQQAVETAVADALRASAADQKWRYVTGTCT